MWEKKNFLRGFWDQSFNKTYISHLCNALGAKGFTDGGMEGWKVGWGPSILPSFPKNNHALCFMLYENRFTKNRREDSHDEQSESAKR